MSETKLLNCPFCKEELEVVGNGHYFAHKTNGCILQHLCFEMDDEEAIKAWNTRKPMERILERLEKESFHRYNDTKEEKLITLDKAIEIVKEEGGIE